eukprot:Sdes_comp19341_c0_seq1m10559
MHENIQLTIKALDSHQYSVELGASATVLQLKEAVEAVSSTPVAQQRLIYQGKVLKDEKTILEYNITSGNVVHMVQKLLPEGSRRTENSQPDYVSRSSVSGFPTRLGGILRNGFVNVNRASNSDSINSATSILGGQTGQQPFVVGAFEVPDGQFPDMTQLVTNVLQSIGGAAANASASFASDGSASMDIHLNSSLSGSTNAQTTNTSSSSTAGNVRIENRNQSSTSSSSTTTADSDSLFSNNYRLAFSPYYVDNQSMTPQNQSLFHARLTRAENSFAALGNLFSPQSEPQTATQDSTSPSSGTSNADTNVVDHALNVQRVGSLLLNLADVQRQSSEMMTRLGNSLLNQDTISEAETEPRFKTSVYGSLKSCIMLGSSIVLFSLPWWVFTWGKLAHRPRFVGWPIVLNQQLWFKFLSRIY